MYPQLLLMYSKGPSTWQLCSCTHSFLLNLLYVNLLQLLLGGLGWRLRQQALTLQTERSKLNP